MKMSESKSQLLANPIQNIELKKIIFLIQHFEMTGQELALESTHSHPYHLWISEFKQRSCITHVITIQ